MSIPRLELLGVFIGAKAAKFCREALDFPSIPVTMFTDSTCVLTWLSTSKLLSTFVSNRIRDIKNLANVTFRHVASEDNPADLCTRGILGSEVSECRLWWGGPTWLSKPQTEWPSVFKCPDPTETPMSDAESEFKKQSVFHTILVGDALDDGHPNNVFPLGMDPTRYSSIQRLLWVTALSLKFVKARVWNKLSPETIATRQCIRKTFDGISDHPRVTAGDLQSAKTLWISAAQRDAFDDIFTAIQTGKSHTLIKQLDLMIDSDGVIRCVGRLAYAETTVSAVQPILLPKKHSVTSLIIRQIHQSLFHAGVAHTLSQIRRVYGIPCGRASVRREITQCVKCRKLKGPPFALPPMPPLPRQRLSRSNPFQFTGLDYLGPVNVSVGGNTQKMWICLFTCLAVRAIHLEFVVDCTAQCFVDCVSRFIARRGTPEEIISDNAPQFRTVKELFDRTWHAVFTDGTTTSYIAKTGIRWKFTVELSPWQGGFYERLVGVVKRALNAVVGRRLLKWDEFVTVVVEAEAIVNSRPLTYVYEDYPSGMVLRPCDFLVEQSTGTPDVDSGLRPEGGDASRNLIRYWKHKQRRLNTLWAHWHDGYLLALRERGSIHHRNSRLASRETPQLDQVVLVKNPGAPRGSWKLARVTKLVTSADDVVRSVEIMLPNRVSIRRSVSHIYPVELAPPKQEDGADLPLGGADDDPIDVPPPQHNNEALPPVPVADIDNSGDVNDDDDDRFSGFSESELPPTVTQHLRNYSNNDRRVRAAIHEGLSDGELVGMAFEMHHPVL